jgi:hypothetical protein
MLQRNVHTQRIRQICAFLSAGGGTLEEMHDWVNSRLEDIGQASIGLRTLQGCIEKLRLGDFDHNRHNEPFKVRSKLFKILYKHKIYRWAPDSEMPAFGDLDEDERYTLPFLAGILKRFESIPSVQKILDQLPEIFNIPESEMESRSAIFQSGPVLYDENNPDFEAKVIKCVIRILGYLNKNQAIEFNYVPVNAYDNRVENLMMHQVAPLQIRYYEHYYYLVAADLDRKQVRNFRVDQIHRLDVSPMLDEMDQPVLFDRTEIEKSTDLRHCFHDSLGVWIHSKEEPLHEIQIRFTKWAASYVKRLRLHPSQRIVSENKTEQTLVISLRVRLMPAKESGQSIESRNPELAFLLARFRENCMIESCRLIQ